RTVARLLEEARSEPSPVKYQPMPEGLAQLFTGFSEQRNEEPVGGIILDDSGEVHKDDPALREDFERGMAASELSDEDEEHNHEHWHGGNSYGYMDPHEPPHRHLTARPQYGYKH